MGADCRESDFGSAGMVCNGMDTKYLPVQTFVTGMISEVSCGSYVLPKPLELV